MGGFSTYRSALEYSSQVLYYGRPCGLVQCRRELVQQNDRRLHEDQPRYSNPLLFSATLQKVMADEWAIV